MADRLQLPIGNRKLEDILMWRDARLSGSIFGGLTVGYLGLEWSFLSVFCLAAYALLTVIGGLLVWHCAAPFVNMSFRHGYQTLIVHVHCRDPPIPSFIRDGLSEEDVKKQVERILPRVNEVLAMVRRAVSGQDLTLSAKVLGGLYAVARVTSIFSLLTLAYLGVLAAFLAPKVYEMRRDEIDGYLEVAKEKLKVLFKQLESSLQKIPRAKRVMKKAE